MRAVPPRAWRWTCPHCGVGSMNLRSAEKHLQRKHYDCWSCKTERLMVHVLRERREAWFGEVTFRRPAFSRV